MTSPAQQVVAAAVALSKLYFFPQISSIPSTTLAFGRLRFRSWKLEHSAQILHHFLDEVRISKVCHVTCRVTAWPPHESEMWRDHENGVLSAGVDQPLEVVDGADQGAVRRNNQLTSRVVPAYAIDPNPRAL